MPRVTQSLPQHKPPTKLLTQVRQQAKSNQIQPKPTKMRIHRMLPPPTPRPNSHRNPILQSQYNRLYQMQRFLLRRRLRYFTKRNKDALQAPMSNNNSRCSSQSHHRQTHRKHLHRSNSLDRHTCQHQTRYQHQPQYQHQLIHHPLRRTHSSCLFRHSE